MSLITQAFQSMAKPSLRWIVATGFLVGLGCSSTSSQGSPDAPPALDTSGVVSNEDGPTLSPDGPNVIAFEAGPFDARDRTDANHADAPSGPMDAGTDDKTMDTAQNPEVQPGEAGASDSPATDAPTTDGADALPALPGTCAIMSRTALTSSGGKAQSPSILWTGSSYLAAWSDDRSGSTDVYFSWRNPDGSRYGDAADVMVAHTGFVTSGAQVSPLGNGRYLLVWEDCRPSLPDCVDGTSVAVLLVDGAGKPQGAITNLTGVANVQRRPYVVSTLGGAYATFREMVGTTTVGKVVRFSDTGILALDTITLGSQSAGLYPYLAAGNGELAVIYRRGIDPAEIVLTRLSASLSPTRELVVRSGPTEATNPVAQWNGTGWVTAWEDAASGDILVQTALVSADASSAGPTHPVQDSNSNWPAMASNGKDTVVAYYGFPGEAQIMLARLDSSGKSVGSVLQVSDNIGRAKFPAVAYSKQSDDFGVVWTDESNGAIVFAEVECR